MKNIEIGGVNLKLGRREVMLTVEEAKKLYKTLKDLFGKEIIKEVHHYDRYPWYWTLSSSSLQLDYGTVTMGDATSCITDMFDASGNTSTVANMTLTI
jgi:hypothetical protein